MPNKPRDLSRCPCCGSDMPANQVRATKRNINNKLAALTNPPMPVDQFIVEARSILEFYGIDPTDILNFGGYAHGQPGWSRNPFDAWNCVLVLGWCYSKMEVAYFS